jgi:hypothetical protein
MGGIQHGNSVKRSISLGEDVNSWAEEMARAAGFGNNFSAFITTLIAEKRRRENALHDKPGPVKPLGTDARAAAGDTAPTKPVSYLKTKRK